MKWFALVTCLALTSCKTKSPKAPADQPVKPTVGPVAEEAPEAPADLCGSVMKIVDAGDSDYDFVVIAGTHEGHGTDRVSFAESTTVLPGAEGCTVIVDELDEHGGVTCTMARGDDRDALEAQRLELIDALTPCFAPDVWASAERSPTSWMFAPLDGQPTHVLVILTEVNEALHVAVEFDNNPAGPQ